MNRYLDIAPEVQEALAAGKPVVALESTIISHGMPYPQNVETASAACIAAPRPPWTFPPIWRSWPRPL